MEFWIKQAESEEWHSIPAEGAVFPTDVYAILTRSPQPHFTISVDIFRHTDGETGTELMDSEDKLHHQKGVTRTDEEGLGEILPPTLLEPGRWEFRCHDGDLIAELFGETQSDSLSFTILPAVETLPDPSELPGDSLSIHEPDLEQSQSEDHFGDQPFPEPEEAFGITEREELWDPSISSAQLVSTQPDPEPGSVSSDAPFSLMHSRLQGAPGEVLVLTGRIRCSGELEARVYNQKQLVFENHRTIRFPADARSAVFSIQVPLPPSPWAGNLIGTLTLRSSTETLPSSLTFTVSCLEQKNGVTSSAPLRSPLLSKAPQEIPLNQYRDSLATDAPDVSDSEPSSNLIPSVGAYRSPAPLSFASSEALIAGDGLFVTRTLRKMLQLCHDEPADSVLEETAVDPIAPTEASMEDAQPEDEISGPETGGWEEEAASVPSPDLKVLADPEPEEDLSVNPFDFPEADEPEPAPPARWSVVSERRRENRSPSPSTQSSTLTQDLPLPEIWVPEAIQAGETVDVVLRLTPWPDDRGPLWLKLWVKQDHTRSILDGPRWLLDFTRTDRGQLQAITRMTVPHGAREIVFEAWAVTSDMTRQGERTLLRRSVR